MPSGPKEFVGAPARQGFFMPPEWAPHAATWVSWPRHDGISFPYGFDGIPEAFASFIAAIARWEPAVINVANDEMETEARAQLVRAGALPDRIRFARIPTDEPWCRDHGPTFLIRQKALRPNCLVVDWDFNAWGGKYAPWDRDNAVPEAIAQFRSVPRHRPGICAEGGAIEVNGTGDLLTTIGCLDAPSRNQGHTRESLDEALRTTLGVERIHWLRGDLIGDDTDGHIDQLARFIDPQTILTSRPHPDDANAPAFAFLRDQLTRLRDSNQRPFRLVEVPLPRRVERQGERLPACYANFIFVNGAVLVPTFNCREDSVALNRFRSFFPAREIVPVDASRLIEGLGALHCLTQQEPATWGLSTPSPR